MNVFDIIVTIFAIIPIVLNVSIFYRIINSKIQNNRLSYLLLWVNNSLVLWILFSYFQWVFEIQVDSNLYLYTILVGGQIIFGLTAINVMAIFTKFLVYPSLNIYQFTYAVFISSIVGGLTITMIYAGSINHLEMVNFANSMANIGYIFVAIPITYFAIRDLQVISQQSLNDNQRRQVQSILNNGRLAILSIPLAIMTIYDISLRIPLTYVILTMVLYYFSKAYFIDPRIAFVLPEKTYLAIISSTYGNLKYRRQFLDEGSDDHSELISGYMVGMKSMMSQFFESNVKPTTLEFEDKKILFIWTNYYYLAVFTEHDSHLIRNAMRETVALINQKYGVNIERSFADSDFLDLDTIFDRTFYFVYR